MLLDYQDGANSIIENAGPIIIELGGVDSSISQPE